MTSGDIPVSGLADAPFGRVRDAFIANFASGSELGARFAVFIDGAAVVDLIGGWADRGRERPFTDKTLAGVYSTGKLVVALLIARVVGEGALDYDSPIASYWPEFGAAGKEAITVADALSHQAGLSGFAEAMPPEDWLDRDRICVRIAAMAPLFPPRSASGYGPQTFGFIADELLRRTTGRGVGRILREDFFERHGVDIHCGLSATEISRAAGAIKPSRPADLGPMTELKRIAFLKPWSAAARVGHEAWMAAEIPSSNIHATAAALADIAQTFAVGGRFRGARLVSPAAVEAATAERILGDDLVLPFRLSWSAGFMGNVNRHFGPSPTAFGHGGHGGSCAMFDPAERLSAAYVMTQMSPHLIGDPRALRLLDAVYAAL